MTDWTYEFLKTLAPWLLSVLTGLGAWWGRRKLQLWREGVEDRRDAQHELEHDDHQRLSNFTALEEASAAFRKAIVEDNGRLRARIDAQDTRITEVSEKLQACEEREDQSRDERQEMMENRRNDQREINGMKLQIKNLEDELAVLRKRRRSDP